MHLQDIGLGDLTCIDFANGAPLQDPPESPAEIRAVARFRVVLRRLFHAEATGLGASEADLMELNRVLRKAEKHRGVLPAVRGYSWGWLDEAGGVERALWPVAWTAARLLTGADADRLKCCDGCEQLFRDGSRNRSRRWCDMEGCGNRAKVRRHRASQR